MKKFADWLFEKFCNPLFYSDIKGDLEEIYFKLLEENPQKKANWKYLKEVLLLFRWSLLRPLPKSSSFSKILILNPIMLKSYFLLGIRHLLKNKLISAFNLLGLTLAIACGTVIFSFIEFEYTVDHFHKDHDRIFVAGFDKVEGKKSRIYGYVPEAIGEQLRTSYAKVEEIVTLRNTRGIVQYEEKTPFYEQISFTNPSYLDVFNFPLIMGNKAALSDPSKVIISYESAIRYFGYVDPIGEVLKISIGEQDPIELEVAGVAEKFPKKRSFDFDLLINLEVWNALYLDRDPWLSNYSATFVKTQTAKDIYEINRLLDEHIPLFNQKRQEEVEGNFVFIPLSDIHTETYRIRNDIFQGYGSPSQKAAFAVIALLLLTIACLNYINTATAQGVKRIKEIGVRKVIGGKKTSIISQFLIEHLVLNLFALMIGLFLAYLFLVPAFDSLFSFGLEFEWHNQKLWLFVLITLFTTTILSGAYPAFYLSKFQPNEILKGNERIKFKSTFSKIFLTIQFFIAFVYIVVGLLFVVNINYQKNKEIGYQVEDVVVVKPKDEAAFQYLQTEFQKSPAVEATVGAFQHVAYTRAKAEVEIGTIKNNILLYTVSSDYLEKLSFPLLKGSIPNLGENNEVAQIVVNEAFVKALGESEVIEKEITIEGQKYFIAGVLKDFYYDDVNTEIEPIIFKFKNAKAYPYLIVKASKGNGSKVLEIAKALWKNTSPNSPFIGYNQAYVYNAFLRFAENINKTIIFASLLAIILSCTGLYGLVYMNLTSRLKDYSIMKVMGASSKDISKEVFRIFLLFLILAIVFGFPASIYGSKFMLSMMFTDYVPINAYYPIISAIFLFVISTTTISALIFKVSKQNPVVALRRE